MTVKRLMRPRKTPIDLREHRAQLLPILRAVATRDRLSRPQLERLLRQHPRGGAGIFSRDELILAYRAFAGKYGLPPYDERIIQRLRRKPVRTSSGVTPVTVLTKPFPCPGECIFCPNDVRMPKSYLADEPGAQRAEQNHFDPYLQTYTRLQTYYATGHPTDKIELIVLGGTWSFYPETYQIWFVKRLLDALHDFGAGRDGREEVEAALQAQVIADASSGRRNVRIFGEDLSRPYNQVVRELYREELRRAEERAHALATGDESSGPADQYASWAELAKAQRENEAAPCRCVGLVVETRPDHISPEEVIRIRRLGGTKVQIGIQSLNDAVLRANRRGHDVAATRRAFHLLRRMGFKIHAHWMPNLYGSSPKDDIADYEKLFADGDFRPDELKIYPCSLLESAELMQVYQRGDWRPYSHEELMDTLVSCFALTPEYCRLTRVIRDIPSTYIVDGNQLTNFRQLVEAELRKLGQKSGDIRARELRFRGLGDGGLAELRLDEQRYSTSSGEEVFLQWLTAERAIAGFLRLSLPEGEPLVAELRDAAVIREVHIYGQALGIGVLGGEDEAQHRGLGRRLVERAARIAAAAGHERLAVISAMGTRAYYRRLGFVDGDLYQMRELRAGRQISAP